MSSDLFQIEGFEELKQMVLQLGQVPRKVARASARAGGQVDLVAVRNAAPTGSGGYHVGSGNLKAALIKAEEKSAYNSSKATFDIRFNKSYNISLVKTILNPGKYGGKKDTAYYPSSQEYGFKTAHNGYVPGFHFMKNSSDENSEAVKKAMIDKATEAIDKVLESR